MVKRKKRKKDGLGYKTGHLPNVAGNEWHHIGKKHARLYRGKLRQREQVGKIGGWNMNCSGRCHENQQRVVLARVSVVARGRLVCTPLAMDPHQATSWLA